MQPPLVAFGKGEPEGPMKQLPNLAALLAVAAALAACAKPLEVASITDIAPKTGSKSIDVHEPRRMSGPSRTWATSRTRTGVPRGSAPSDTLSISSSDVR